MDEQNLLETKSTSELKPSEQPVLVPTPHTRGKKLALIYILAAMILITAGFFGYYQLNKTKNSQNQIETSKSNSSVSQIASLPYGFPVDLFFEPEAKIIKDESNYSADGKILTIERSYESKRSLELNSKVTEALQKKGWQVADINNSDVGKKLTFVATKDNNHATVTITALGTKNSLVDISVTLSVK